LFAKKGVGLWERKTVRPGKKGKGRGCEQSVATFEGETLGQRSQAKKKSKVTDKFLREGASFADRRATEKKTSEDGKDSDEQMDVTFGCLAVGAKER